jgi:hypothetical protein
MYDPAEAPQADDGVKMGAFRDQNPKNFIRINETFINSS